MNSLDPTSDPTQENAISSPGQNLVFLGISSYVCFLQFELAMNHLRIVHTTPRHRVADDLYRASFGSIEIYG